MRPSKVNFPFLPIENREVNFHKATRPSVPGKRDKFGYTFMRNAETPAIVEVVANFNPFIIAGDSTDCVGPGHYDVPHETLDPAIQAHKITYSKKNPRFKIDKRACNSTIGPGVYDPNVMVPNYKFKGTSNFLNRGPRSVMEFDMQIFNKNILPSTKETDDDFDYIPNCIPGPGSYYDSDRETSFKSKAILRKNKKKGKTKSFCTTIPRFVERTQGINPLVGPGTYADAKSKLLLSKSFNHRNVPFNSEALRDYEREKYAALIPEGKVPGPGAYDDPKDMVTVLRKKMELHKRRNRVRSDLPLNPSSPQPPSRDPTFITTGAGTNKLIPGPGAYHGAHRNPLKAIPINNYTFLSGIDRFKLPDPEAPPPGTYDINTQDCGKILKKAMNYLPFNSACDRFEQEYRDLYQQS